MNGIGEDDNEEEEAFVDLEIDCFFVEVEDVAFVDDVDDTKEDDGFDVDEETFLEGLGFLEKKLNKVPCFNPLVGNLA